MKRILIIAIILFAKTLHSQDNRFVEWPFLRDICTIDTSCAHYQRDHIATTTDSIFDDSGLLRIEKRNYNAKGQLVSILSIAKDTTELLTYGFDAQGKVIMASLQSITGKDTSTFFKSEILKYDTKQNRPFTQHYHTKPDPSVVEKQFIDDRLIFKYSETKAAIHWYTAYVTDNYIKNTYDNPKYGWIQEQLCLHEKDTMYRRINYYNLKYNPVKCETFIWSNDSTKTETIVDSLYNITETITWTNKKISEHHFYTTEYSGKMIRKMIITNAMAVPNQRQFVIEYLPNETVVTPENGEPIHLDKSLEGNPPPPPMPPIDQMPFTYKTRKVEGALIRYDYFNFHISTSPLYSMWFNDKGVMVKSVLGKVVTKRSYQYR